MARQKRRQTRNVHFSLIQPLDLIDVWTYARDHLDRLPCLDENQRVVKQAVIQLKPLIEAIEGIPLGSDGIPPQCISIEWRGGDGERFTVTAEQNEEFNVRPRRPPQRP